MDSEDQNLIDQALDQLTADDLTRYLESLASPSPGGAALSPAGVGSQASRTPSTGARTSHRGSLLLSFGAHTPHSGSPRFSPRVGGRSRRASTPRGRPGRGRRGGRGRPPRPQPSPSLPLSRPSSSQQVTPRGSPRGLLA